jgi:ATP-dependent RNA helicase DeaD
MGTAADFEAFDLDPRLLQGIKDMGFDELFPIQAEAIAPILQGRDLIGQAHTGSGKTLAYAVPMLQNLNPGQRAIQGLVLVPTRELAVQVAGEFEKLARHLGVRTVPVYGGQSINVQIDRLEDPRTKIIVATPGRLMDHLERRTASLDGVKFVVLDEADRMLDMGFIDDITDILSHVPRTHQTALFSATIPDQIVRLSQRYLRSPVTVFVDSDELSVDTVDQKIIQLDEDDKFRTLCSLLERDLVSRGLVFCATKIRADRLAQALEANHYDAMAIHGDLSQRQRDFAIHAFRTGKTGLLIATDVAARGLDIPKVSHVINFDMPEDPTLYFHRIGRTARAGKRGIAISFLTREDWNVFEGIRRMTSATLDEIQQPIVPGLNIPRLHLPSRPFGGPGAGGFQRPRQYNQRRYDQRGRRRNPSRW